MENSNQQSVIRDKKRSALKNVLLDLFFPSKCVTCGKLGEFLCTNCFSEIIFCESQVCPRCNQITNKGKFCARCRQHVFLSGVIAAGYFKDPFLKEIIHSYKYEGIFSLGEKLSDFIIEKIKKEGVIFDMITFVPITRGRKRYRGYNQSEILANNISGKLGKPNVKILLKIKETKTQVGLKRKEREKNLNGVFGLTRRTYPIKGKRVLLVDDVITTGTTLNECAKVLRKAGAREIWGAVIAKE